MSLTLPGHTYDAGRFVVLNLNFDKPAGPGLSWVIDEHGNEVTRTDESGNQVRCTRVVGDAYNRDQASLHPTLPDPDDFHLGPLPPIDPQPAASDPPKPPAEPGADGSTSARSR